MRLYLELAAMSIPVLTGMITTFFEIKTAGRLNRWGWTIVVINVLAVVLAGMALVASRQEEAAAEQRAAQLAAQKEQLARQERELAEQERQLRAAEDKAWEEYAQRRVAQLYFSFSHDGPVEGEAELMRRLTLLQYIFQSNLAPADGSAGSHMAIVSFETPPPGGAVERLMATPARGRGQLVHGPALAQTDLLENGLARRGFSGSLSWSALGMDGVVPTVGSLADLNTLKLVYPRSDADEAARDIAGFQALSVAFELAGGQTVQCFFDPAVLARQKQEVTGFPSVEVSGKELLRAVEAQFRAHAADPEAAEWLTVTLPQR